MITYRPHLAINQFLRKFLPVNSANNHNMLLDTATSNDKRPYKHTIATTISAVTLSMLAMLTPGQALAAPTSSAKTLTLTTWNIEHLAEKNNTGCKPRTDSDYAALRRFAKGLNADVVALQEVESKAAVHRVFPRAQWNVIISSRPNSKSYVCRGSKRKSTQQKVAIAVRKGVRYRSAPSLSKLGLRNPGLRHGVTVDLLDTRPKTRVLALHLKSGCFTNDYHSPNQNKPYQIKSCKTLKRQVPILLNWAKTQLKQSNTAVVMMGDFNHQLANAGNVLWTELLAIAPNGRSFINAMANKRACHPRYPKPIDHILMGPQAYKDYVPNSVTVHYFGSPTTMTKQNMLSDHCPVSVKLRKS